MKLVQTLGVVTLVIAASGCGGLEQPDGASTRRKATGTYCDDLPDEAWFADPFCNPWAETGQPVDTPEPPPPPQPPAAEPPPVAPPPAGCFDGDFDADKVRAKIRSCYEDGRGDRPAYLDSNYQPAPNDTPASLRHDSSHAGWTIMSWVGWAAGNLIQIAASFRDRVHSYVGCPSSARQLLDEVSSKINHMPGASKAQKVCAAQCVSSRIIDYEVDHAAAYLGISVSVARGVGKCTEFASIAKYLMNGSHGVSATYGFSPYHAFVRATFDGHTWNLEPQQDPSWGDGHCTYYRQP